MGQVFARNPCSKVACSEAWWMNWSSWWLGRPEKHSAGGSKVLATVLVVGVVVGNCRSTGKMGCAGWWGRHGVIRESLESRRDFVVV